MKKYQSVARDLRVVERAACWNPRLRCILKAAPLMVMFLLLNSPSARAACNFNPSPDPTVDGAPNSLRSAIIAANASGQDCLIQLQAGTYTLTIKNTSGQENAAAQGDLDITDSGHTVTVQGQALVKGTPVSIVNGNHIDRVFQVLSGANATFANLTIEGGIAQDDGTGGALPGTTVSEGGGLLVQDGANVTFSEVWIQGNEVVGGGGINGTSGAPNGTPGQAATGGGLFLSAGSINLVGSNISANATVGGIGGDGHSGHCNSSDRSCVTILGYGGAGGAASGGGIYVLSGSAQLQTSTFSGNSASGARGGGGGWLPGNESRHASQPEAGGNGGAAQGGGLFVAAGTLSLRRSTVSGNSALGGRGGSGVGTGASPMSRSLGGQSQGGGMYIATGIANIVNSTAFGNTANGGKGGSTEHGVLNRGGETAGGGLYLGNASVSLAGVTVASNQALASLPTRSPTTTGRLSYYNSSGGGIAGGGLFINTTIIGNNSQNSGNTSNGNDVSGPITSSYSLISQTAGATITDDGGNIFNVNPQLDLNGLQSNGGPTNTVALEVGSPAIDVVPVADCKDQNSNPITTDQRGMPRPDAGENVCDIGAYEFQEPPATVTLSPSSLNFGNQMLGSSSSQQMVTLSTSSPSLPLTITSIATSGPFAQTNNCGHSVATGGSCTVKVTFAPTALGTQNGTLMVSDNGAGSPQTVPLSGTGVRPAVTLSPTSLAFTTQVVFTTSKAKTVKLSNAGTGTLSISSIAMTGPFHETKTCGTSLAPGANCNISVTFRPTAKGPVTGSVSIKDNAPGSPQKLGLAGTGTYIQLSPTSLNFSNQPMGTKSLAQRITMSNKSDLAVSIASISVTGTNARDFAETKTCGNSLASGASCFITVTFKPLATGRRTASISVSDNGGGSPQQVALLGTGT